VALSLAVWTVPLARAQPEDAAGEPVTSSVDAPVPITQIAAEARRSQRLLRSFEQAVEPGPLVERIAETLPTLTASFDEQDSRTDRLAERASLDALEDLRSQWSQLGLPLAGWREQLIERASEADSMLRELDRIEAVWLATRQEARARGAPEATHAAVAAVFDDLASTRETVGRRRASLLTLDANVSALQSRVDGALSTIEESRQQLVRRLLERNEVPIWSTEVREHLSEDLSIRISASVAGEREEAERFTVRNADRFLLQLALLTVLGIALIFARSRVRRRTEDETGLGAVAEIFEYPISVALLLTILASPWIFDVITPVIQQVLGFAALIPAIFILRRFTAQALLPLLNALVVFYLLDRVRELASALPTLARLVFLVELLGGIVFLAWLLRPGRVAEIPSWAAQTRALRVLGLGARAALVLFVVAFLTEILGYSRLAQLVGGAVLESAYVGVVAYTAVRILDSLSTFLLRVPPLGLLGIVRHSRFTIRRRVRRGLELIAVVVWTLTSLELVALRSPLFETVAGWLSARLEVGSISVSLGAVLAFVLTIVVSFQLSRFVRFVLEQDVFPRLRLRRGVPYAVSNFTHYAILLLGFFLAVGASGIDLDKFAFVAGALGVGIGFGLQNVVNNFVSGLILLSERPVQVGDTIEAGSALGEVKRIGIRSSTVRTWSGAELIVPNAELISERVINWTLSDRQRRVDVPVGVAYGTDKRKVLEILDRVAQENPDVLDRPEPIALFMGFGESSLDFELRAWTDSLKQYLRVKSALGVEIGEALDEAGIEVPFPQRDLHLRSVDETAARRLVRESEEA
jgi:small-conductance mechanosensitive channel